MGNWIGAEIAIAGLALVSALLFFDDSDKKAASAGASRLDLNGDGVADFVFTAEKSVNYFISDGTNGFQHGRLVTDSGAGFIRMDNGADYSFGSYERDGSNVVYRSDRLHKLDFR